MDPELEGRLYGTLYAHLVELAQEEGMESAIRQLESMEPFEIRMILACLVYGHAHNV